MLLPTKTVPSSCLDTVRLWAMMLAKRLNVCVLMNCQYTITASGDVFLLEAKIPVRLVQSHLCPRQSGTHWQSLLLSSCQGGYDVLLGPKMHSTDEVMGIDFEFAAAFTKVQNAAGQRPSVSGTVFIRLNDLTKPHIATIAQAFLGLGFKIVSTSGTAHVIELEGITVERVLKLHKGRPHAGDMITNGQIQLMVITSLGDSFDQIDGRQLGGMALAYKIPIITTVAGALASVEAIRSMKCSTIKMVALQGFFDVQMEPDSCQSLQPASSSL
ncbi:hypothetical protein HHK36_010846 [Tetracentron sinense]|uniref:carbamoyl-phosphate synthase (glutamine-hydrolyzing) n=1 Tax=Tetracentron sinense TaxID=13715 RepID=A0A834ZF32_TETSI|nr:hypothetical protein HHK36_010846 [Tetracentron sinense]